MRLRELLRTTTFRLSLLYGLIFTIGAVALLGLVYLQSAVYLTRRVDRILAAEASSLAAAPPAQLSRRIDEAISLGGERNNVIGLFSPSHAHIAGNLASMPPTLQPGGPPVEVPPSPRFSASARLIARKLPDGDVLAVGRDVNQLQEMRRIIASALLGSGLVIILAGIACGAALSLGPLRRLRALQDACGDIASGDLTRRMPVSGRDDELDMFAGTVNHMMGEVERLLVEVKASTDTIAHDLRTPLTRARAQLHRLQQASADSGDLARVIAELDTVLERFRALMRISELETHARRAGFGRVRLADILEEITALFEPLAEAGGVKLTCSGGGDAIVEADAKLLFEAVSNLVDNAIKFSGEGGEVALRIAGDGANPQIVVEDNGPGIPASEKSAVLQRFYRGERDRVTPGSGLGLSIAAAILRLHRFELELRDANPGLAAVIICRTAAISH
jgi:signal transduction histidine kinase